MGRFVNIDNLRSQQHTTTQLSMTEDQAEAGIPFSILNELFDRELEEVLLRIFLYLDPCSLKNSRLTCSMWNEFVFRRIWTSKTSRKCLTRRLERKRKSEEPTRLIHRRLESQVHFMACDESLVLLSMEETGDVLAYHAHHGHFKYKV